jgi:hypothetical protein
MAHSPDDSPAQSRVVLLGDHDTAQHRDCLTQDAAQHGCTIAEVFSFESGEPASTEHLSEVDSVMSALACAITGRMDLWVPFPGPDLGREQHSRRLSLVLQRHGLNLRGSRELISYPTDGGVTEIDFALRREVKAVDSLDHAVLAAMGAKTLGQEIEQALAATPTQTPVARRAPAGARANAGARTDRVLPPALPAPTEPWPRRQPVLKRYVRWLVHGCGVTQVATARVLNSTGQRTPKGRLWQPSTVSALLNGRYDGGAKVYR